MKKSLISLALAAATATACAQQRVLVLYYSQTGTTQAVAEELCSQLGADIERIEAVVPYDGDFQATIQRSGEEMKSGQLPAIKPVQSRIADYDIVFVGYPIWFGTYAMPIAALVRDYDFAGKAVVPFCTFGSGGLNTSSEALRKALSAADVRQGYGVRAARLAAAPAEIDRFLKEQGYKAGTVTPLPEYSEQRPVTEADCAVFSAACSDYQFPLGTPLTVGTRTTATSTDYRFSVRSRGMDGKEATTIIYVTHSTAPGAKPEFTEVVR